MTNNQDNLSGDSPDPGAPEVPDHIGPYKILSVIGEGGMGIVYLAEQQKPVRRRVALKLIKPGMDSKAVLARFEAERQALALMDHPTIAKVFEAGTTKQGQPFFAMEYVKGLSLTDYCDRQKLPLKERLGLFMEVCRGVQHAHQKAVIHRDLKPSNILVAESEDKPSPKIIDFGLAKALGGQRLTEMSLFTEQGALVGTPEYMSPEQVDPTALDVDTRTDIYSLGTILYQLLTDTLPFETEDLRMAAQIAAILSIRKRICEEEPQKPSTRVSSTANVASVAGQKSKLEHSTLTRRLRGDLDWITMKALEKDRARRYATATDLAADIEHHLNHDPVSAGPPSSAYKQKKFARKNAGLVASVTSLIVLLVAGVVISTFFYFQSEERRTEAENATKQEKTAKNLAIEKENEAVAATEREKEQREEAVAAKQEAVAARQREKEQREEAERQRDEILRLSDIKHLQELEDEADDLWPAHPDKVGAMEDWLRRANELTENLDIHRTSLTELRQQASQGPDEKKDAPIEGLGQNEDEEAGIWRFAATEMQWRHDVLLELVAGLQAFSNPDPKIGTIASVGDRLVFARTVRSETIEKYDVEWEEAIASIRVECTQYTDLTLKPQVGLVPIGRDPDSGLWEFAHLQTGEIPERTADGKLWLSEEMGIVFVLMPGGKFRMGAQSAAPKKPNFDGDASSDEGPVHEITLDSFFLSKYEMTQAQWERFVGKNPSRYGAHNYEASWDRASARTRKKLMGLHPVEQVSWEDCRDVMRSLSLALPTEAQWEYAARAGTNTVYFTGNEVTTLQGSANLADSFAKKNGAPSSWNFEEKLDDGFTVHAPVGRFNANRFGLHDMHGNLWEQCRDGKGLYNLPVDPATGERQVSGARNRVIRGGSFLGAATYARSANRLFNSPEIRDLNVGLRPSRRITTE